MTEEIKIDQYHWHEVVDRSYLCMEILATALEDHPVITTRPELSRLLDEAHSALYRLYQRAAQLHVIGSEVTGSDAAKEPR